MYRPKDKRQRAPQILPEQTLAIREEYITLGQLLKIAGIIATGGEAKYYLAEQVPLVNGEPDQRRGRKLRPGDLIQFPNEAPIRLTENENRNEGMSLRAAEDNA